MAIGSPKSNTTPVAKQSRTHAHLSQSHDPEKGRQLHATATIKAGEVLLIDPPYAAIPVVDDPVSSDDVLCSNSDCRRKVPRDTRGVKRIGCPNRCADEVVWCNTICRDADVARHSLECAWLKGYARALREDEGEYYFGVLWLIIRVLAMRYIEQKQSISTILPAKEKFSSGWMAMTELCDNRKLWPREDLREWKWLVRKYICTDPSLQDIILSPDDILTLICQQESNSFGLYPRATGIPSSTDRGEQYGAAIFPRSSIANHSCYPNITHKPDDHGRMVFTASRDIVAGQECCISYMDLSGDVDITTRRRHLQEQFSFTCQCERCRAGNGSKKAGMHVHPS